MKKVALCIGINEYENMLTLDNCINDATDLSNLLSNLGFDSKLILNATQMEILRELKDFKSRVDESTVSLIFFAGHGLKVETDNFIVPKDAKIEFTEQIPYVCINASDLFISDRFANEALHIIILDACRDNPFTAIERERGIEIGLNNMSAPLGTLISFATSPGRRAIENTTERNGNFTKFLLQEIIKPNLTIEQVFRNTRTAVMEFTNNRQIPWEESSLHGADFSFIVVDENELRIDNIIKKWLNSTTEIELPELISLFDESKLQNNLSIEKLHFLFSLFDIGFTRETEGIVANTVDQDYYTSKRVNDIFPILQKRILESELDQYELLDLDKIEIIDDFNYGFNFIWEVDESFPQIMLNNILFEEQICLLSLFVTSNDQEHIVNPILYFRHSENFTFKNFGILKGKIAEIFLNSFFEKRKFLEKDPNDLSDFKWD